MKLESRLTLLIFGLALSSVIPVKAEAQVYQRIAPNIPPANPIQTINAPKAPAPLPSSSAAILPALKGVVFVPGPSGLTKAGLPISAAGQNGIEARQIPLLQTPNFTVNIQPFIGRPMSLDALNKIAKLTLDWYRTHGHPFVDIAIPPQNINNGLVQVLVTEYKVGDVTVTGNHWFSKLSIKNSSGLKRGQTLSVGQLNVDLAWLNDNPFKTVNAVFSPGATAGTTNVDLRTKDEIPFRIYGGYDNEGVPSLGKNEWDIGFNWGNAFGLDQILSYQFTRSFSGRFTGNSISDTIPLPWRDKILIFGSYEQQTPLINEYFSNLGRSGQASFRYVHTLPSFSWLSGDLEAGYDFKTTNSNLEFGGFQIFNNSAQINQFVLTYDGNERDSYGQTAVENDLIISPGGLTGANTTNAFESLVPYATSHYVYDRIGVTRTINLPYRFSSVSRAIVQFSNENLMDSEQLAGGGPDSVSGYDTDTILGSQGELLNQQILAPSFSPNQLAGLPLKADNIAQLGVFWDYANLYQVHQIVYTPKRAELASVGLTLHDTIGLYSNVQFDMGWQLRNAPGVVKRGAFGQVSVVVGF